MNRYRVTLRVHAPVPDTSSSDVMRAAPVVHTATYEVEGRTGGHAVTVATSRLFADGHGPSNERVNGVWHCQFVSNDVEAL